METDIPTGDHEEPVARGSGSSRGGPMAQQYCVFGIVFVLSVIALGLGGAAFSMGQEALDLAKMNSESIRVNTQTIMAVEQVSDVGAALPPPPAAAFPSPPSPSVPIAPASTPPPTSPPAPDYSEETLLRNPRWFVTSHDAYEALAGSEFNQDHHSHLLAGLFCHTQDMDLCPYESYCPRGSGDAPYRGGPPGITDGEKQWAPFVTKDVSAASSQAGGTWVLVGTMPVEDGGTDENGFGRCVKWSEWMGGLANDIEDSYEEDNRKWVLCCEKGGDFRERRE